MVRKLWPLLLVLFVVALLLVTQLGREETPRPFPEAPPPADDPTEVPILVAPDGPGGREPGGAPPEPAGTEASASDGPRVVIADPDGLPVAGAALSWSRGTDSGSGRSGADGSVLLPLAPGEGVIALRVEAPGHLTIDNRFLWSEEIALVLRPVFEVSGRVVDSRSRKAIPGAALRMVVRRGDPEPAGVASGPDGSYALEGVPLGRRVQVLIEAEGYPPQYVALELEETVQGTSRDLEIRPGVLLTGRVFDHDDLTPIAGAMVRNRASILDSVSADEQGRFESLFLPPPKDDRVPLLISAPGYCMVQATITNTLLESTDVVPVPLFRAAALEGVLRDAAGRPVAGARVGALPVVESQAFDPEDPEARPATPIDNLPEYLVVPPRAPGRSPVTGTSGRWRVEGLVPWTERVRVIVEREDHQPVEVEVGPLGGPGETTSVDVLVEPEPEGGTIEGDVRLDGEPTRASVAWIGPRRSGRLLTGTDGAYRLEGIAPGTVELTARPEGGEGFTAGGLVETGRAEMEVELGSVLRHDFDLQRVPATATISGLVTDSGGEPLEGALLRVVRIVSGESVSALSGPDGRWTCQVPDVPESLDVELVLGAVERSQGGIQPGQDDVDFVLPPLGRVRCRVLDARDGKPLPAFELHWKELRAALFEHAQAIVFPVADGDGLVSVRIPAGLYDLMVRSDGDGFAAATLPGIRVPARGSTPPLEFRLQPGMELELAIGEDAEPFPPTHLVLLLEDEVWEAVWLPGLLAGDRLRTGLERLLPAPSLLHRVVDFDAGGRAHLRGLAPGRMRFKVFPDDLDVEPESIELTGDLTQPVVLRWN